MSPATAVPATRDGVRLLVLDPSRAGPVDAAMHELPRFLRARDLLVVNDAATLPASIHGRTAQGHPIELRLLGPIEERSARAVLLGAGDFRTRTEHRPPPPAVAVGDALELPGLRATVIARAPLSPRLLDLRFDLSGAELLAALYRAGQPVHYAYHTRSLPLYEFQTAYGGRPWAAEMPSAGRPLSFALLLALRARGVRAVALTHAAGLSETGDPAIDAALPLPERFEISAMVAAAVADARACGGRVIAVGTSAARALEASAAQSGQVSAGRGETDLIIDAHHRPQVADGLLTGMHEPTESHYRLLQAFARPSTLDRALAHAFRHGYRSHEFGDSMLVIGERPSRARAWPEAMQYG